jgi:hypothetical protein
MPLFNESIESIAQAIVTVKRALKAGVIEKEDYKEFNDYLAKRAKDFKIKKTHMTRANKNLDDELETEVKEFMLDEDDALRGWAEEFLQEHEKDDDKDLPYNWGIVVVKDKPACKAEVKADVKEDKQAAACKAWAKMDDEERAAMAAIAMAWQK